MEKTDIHKAKAADSAYSTSCNSQSQRSGSSKSRHSTSSGSSGYGGHPSTSSGNDTFPHPSVTKRNKDKKKKIKASVAAEYLEQDAKQVAADNAVTIDTCGATTGTHSAAVPNPDSEALQLAALTQTLSCLRKLKNKNLPAAIPEESEPLVATAAIDEQSQEQILNYLKTEQCIQSEDEFSAVVSMQDGLVVYTTASLTSVLGFPKDMWLGRSFIDFVHPKDRIAFAGHITSGVITPFAEGSGKGPSASTKKPFFCSLRQYRGLRSGGFGVTEKKVTYLPFQLVLTFREVTDNNKTPGHGPHGIYLLISAKLIKSAYKQPDETQTLPKFVTRHLPTCQLSHVDYEGVPQLGFLPQDMIGHSVFDFYHPEDLPLLKEVYEGVVKMQGHPFRSKPYRFRTQNGGYVLLETEWSSFINPWSRKLEFIIGQHRVLKGPENPDVFAAVEDEAPQISEEVIKVSKLIQEEIENLLSETLHGMANSTKQLVSKRCKDLATFMENLMEQVGKPGLNIDLPAKEQSFSERDSVMLGEISPHHDHYDSKASTETPPSYNQLNYNDNIQRFFESKPKTTLSDESVEMKTEANRSTDEEKSLPVVDSSIDSSNRNRKCHSPVNESGSGSGLSSGSTGVGQSAASCGETSTTSHRSYKPPHLTEALLYRHNEDMEKQMVQKHREQRHKGGDRDSKPKESRHKCAHNKLQALVLQDQCHGVKRSVSHSWEGEPLHSSKHQHMEGGKEIAGPPLGLGLPPLYQGLSNVNLWPPFSVSVTPIHSSQPCSTHSTFGSPAMANHPAMTSMYPMYYIPASTPQTAVPGGIPPQEHPGPPQPQHVLLPSPQPSYMPPQVSYMNTMGGMLCPMQPMYGMPPMMYHPSMGMMQPATMLAAPAPQPATVPASYAIQKHQVEVMSECSKKEEDKMEGKAGMNSNDFSVTGDDDSYSSFYSFLKTEKSDESMKSSPDNCKEYVFFAKPEDMVWEKSEESRTVKPRPTLREPPWLEDVRVTPELVLRYQLEDRALADVLNADLKSLNKTYQPILVNEQLGQLYADMERDGEQKIDLEDRLMLSSSSGDDSQASLAPHRTKKKRRSSEYAKLVMIFEENAPLPPPNHK